MNLVPGGCRSSSFWNIEGDALEEGGEEEQRKEEGSVLLLLKESRTRAVCPAMALVLSPATLSLEGQREDVSELSVTEDQWRRRNTDFTSGTFHKTPCYVLLLSVFRNSDYYVEKQQNQVCFFLCSFFSFFRRILGAVYKKNFLTSCQHRRTLTHGGLAASVLLQLILLYAVIRPLGEGGDAGVWMSMWVGGRGAQVEVE